jgi:hypothetical protein
MKRIGSKGPVTRVEYSSWPLFKDFRNTTEFLATYKELFGEEFILPKVDDLEDKEEKKVSTKVAE